MPHTLSDMNLSLKTCFEDASPETRKHIRDLVSIATNLNKEQYPGISDPFDIARCIDQDRYGIWLTGSRATYLVFKELQKQGKLPDTLHWAHFNMKKCAELFYNDRDYDIQLCYKITKFPGFDGILSEAFKKIKACIAAHSFEESNDNLSCSNGIIGVSMHAKTTDELDITNLQFRINLLTGAVECKDEQGFKLLIQHRRVNMPSLKQCISHPDKNRGQAKMAYFIRHASKALVLDFILSADNLSQLTHASQSSSIQHYAQAKFNDLALKEGPEKIAYLSTLAGKETDTWLTRMLIQDKYNTDMNMPTLLPIPCQSADLILLNIRKIVEHYRKPYDKKEKISAFISASLNHFINIQELQRVIDGLKPYFENGCVHASTMKALSESLASLTPKTNSPKSVTQSPDSNTSSNHSSNSPTASVNTLFFTPTAKRKIRPDHEEEAPSFTLKNEQIAKAIALQRKEYDDVYSKVALDFDRLENELKLNTSKIKKQTCSRAIQILNIICKDEEIKHPTKNQIMVVAACWSFIASVFILIVIPPNETEDNKGWIPSMRTLITTIIGAAGFLFGAFHAHFPDNEMRARIGLDDALTALNDYLPSRKNKIKMAYDDQIQLYTHLACAVFYAAQLEHYDEHAMAFSIAQFSKHPKIYPGIKAMSHAIYHSRKFHDGRIEIITAMMNALATFDHASVIVILSDRHLNLTLKDSSAFIAEFTAAINRNAEQYASTPLLPNPQI